MITGAAAAQSASWHGASDPMVGRIRGCDRGCDRSHETSSLGEVALFCLTLWQESLAPQLYLARFPHVDQQFAGPLSDLCSGALERVDATQEHKHHQGPLILRFPPGYTPDEIGTLFLHAHGQPWQFRAAS